MLTKDEHAILSEMRAKPDKTDGERLLLIIIDKLEQAITSTQGAALAHIAGSNVRHGEESAQLVAENARLRAELAEDLETILHSEGRRRLPGEPHEGWWDSCADGSAITAGDRLVELGLYERHPDGVGRRQFYRRKEV